PLHHGASQWCNRACKALYGSELDERYRPKDRETARLRSDEGDSDVRRYGQSQSGRSAEKIVSIAPRRQQLLAELVQRPDQADLHSGDLKLLDDHDRPGEAQYRERLAGGRGANERALGK